MVLERRLAPAGAGSPIPVTAGYAISEALGRDNASYSAASGSGGTFAMANQANGYSATVGQDGFRVGSGEDAWSLTVRGIGYGDDVRALAAATPRAEGNRVEYDHGEVTQWYVNGPLGLQQGFTIDARPRSIADGGPLTILLDIHGLTPVADPGGTSVGLARGDGPIVATYGGLVAYDANGRAIPATMTVDAGATVSISVDDADAVYPLVVDPVVQDGDPTTIPGAAALGFALALSADGQTLVATTPRETVGGSLSWGAIYVFDRVGTAWNQTARIDPGDLRPTSEAIDLSDDGSTLLVQTLAGVVRIYTRRGSTWAASVASLSGDWSQGAALSGDGEMVAITTDDFRQVVLYRKGGAGAWAEVGRLTYPDWPAGGRFGASLALDGDGSTLVVGAPSLAEGAKRPPAFAYIFEEGPSAWTLAHREPLPTPGIEGGHGEAVDISADGSAAVIFGAKSDASPSALVVLSRSGSGWGRDAGFAIPAELGLVSLGRSADLSPDGSALVVSARSNAAAGGSPNDVAYLYRRTPAGWSRPLKFGPATGVDEPKVAMNVAVAGGTVVVSDSRVYTSRSLHTFAIEPGVDVVDGPYDWAGVLGRSATFSAVATLPGLQARWQVQAAGATDWVDVPGATSTATVGDETRAWYTFTVTPDRSGSRLRVVFRDPSSAMDVVVSDPALLTTARALANVDFQTSPQQPNINEPTTFVVYVDPTIPGVPAPSGGTVRLKLSTGELTQTLVDGRATFVVDGLRAVDTSIVGAVYDGDAYTAPSESSYRRLIVVRGHVDLTVEVPAQARAGAEVDLKAVVAPMGGGAVPTGGVVFFDGGRPIGFVQLAPSAGGAAAATYRTTLTAGDHYFQWVYLGDPRTFSASSAVYKTTAMVSGSPAAGLAAPLAGTVAPPTVTPPPPEHRAPDLGPGGAILAGETAWFFAPAGAEYDSVRWQVRRPGEAAWVDVPGTVDAAYRRVVMADDDGLRVRAVLTSGEESVATEPQTLVVTKMKPVLKLVGVEHYATSGVPWAALVTATSPIIGGVPPSGGLAVAYGTVASREDARDGLGRIDLWQPYSTQPPPTSGVTPFTISYDGSDPLYATAEHTQAYTITRSIPEGPIVMTSWSPPYGLAPSFTITMLAVSTAPAPTGGVLVLDGGRPIAFAPLVPQTSSRSVATIDPTTIPPGRHYFQFVYLGDRYNFAVSSPVYVEFKPEPSTDGIASRSIVATTDALASREILVTRAPASPAEPTPTNPGVPPRAASSRPAHSTASSRNNRFAPPLGRRIATGRSKSAPWRTASLLGGQGEGIGPIA